LLTGYLACSDRKFNDYIEKFKDEHEEGTNITYQDLMRKAELKYQFRIMSGEWNALTQKTGKRRNSYIESKTCCTECTL
jgi:hypothetical protein